MEAVITQLGLIKSKVKGISNSEGITRMIPREIYTENIEEILRNS
jgi:hypothetical protein